MQNVIIGHNAIDPQSYTKHCVNDVRELLMELYPTWPTTARIYNGQISHETDITPRCKADVERLSNFKNIYVIVYPSDPFTILLSVAATAALVAAVFLLRPSIPEINQGKSSNNKLAGRENQARPLARIPDIFGSVKSFPDLIMVPYVVIDNHLDLETSYLCIGRGEYDFSDTDVFDGDTLLRDISATRASFYGPNDSPNAISPSPILEIGGGVSDDIISTVQLNQVNGQVLRPPKSEVYAGSSDVRFSHPNVIGLDPIGQDLTELFSSGDLIQISGAGSVTGSGDPQILNLNTSGSERYTILSVSESAITLSDPSSVNSDWDLLDNFTAQSDHTSAVITSDANKWIGPFVVNGDAVERIINNFYARGGSYKISNDGDQSASNVEIEVELQEIDSGGSPVGSPITSTSTVFGSGGVQTARGVTLDFDHSSTFIGRCEIRARRVTAHDQTFIDDGGRYVDEVVWREAYSVTPVTLNDFGNITTVHVKTLATSGALQVRNRKLNVDVQRKINLRISGSDFDTSTTGTNDAAEIISFICKDQFIGGRANSEIDFDSIYNSVSAIETYFGDSLAKEFNYTFDQLNTSFEETLAIVATAIFSSMYRQGNIIKLHFEQATENSILLFNHRNKLPGSETRTVRFGREGDVDGVEITYIDPITNESTIYQIPIDGSAVNPRRVELIGVRSQLQAQLHAWRIWNKVQFQNTIVEFTALQEAALLINNQRILVADNTRQATQDGEIIAQDNLTLTTTTELEFIPGETYTAFIQHVDGSVEAIAAIRETSPTGKRKMVLANAPSQTLNIGDNKYAQPTFILAKDTDLRPRAFLMSENGLCLILRLKCKP